MGTACSTNRRKRNAYRVSVGKPEGKSPLGRPRCRWDIKTDIRETGCSVWFGFIWLRIGISGGLLLTQY
jgi:hypothetical protein